MIDSIARVKCMAEFAIYAAREGYDVTCMVSVGGVEYFRNETQELFRAYLMGRKQEREENEKAALSFITVPVVSSTDWQSVNAVARSTG